MVNAPFISCQANAFDVADSGGHFQWALLSRRGRAARNKFVAFSWPTTSENLLASQEVLDSLSPATACYGQISGTTQALARSLSLRARLASVLLPRLYFEFVFNDDNDDDGDDDAVPPVIPFFNVNTKVLWLTTRFLKSVLDIRRQWELLYGPIRPHQTHPRDCDEVRLIVRMVALRGKYGFEYILFVVVDYKLLTLFKNQKAFTFKVLPVIVNPAPSSSANSLAVA
ncbi:hypothetical protein CPC08DRAFT_722322 [Agrocybe pediades]|nr:hypothetical protein CPC08DRAFT_722322 [Agrocybe pediades]